MVHEVETRRGRDGVAMRIPGKGDGVFEIWDLGEVGKDI